MTTASEYLDEGDKDAPAVSASAFLDAADNPAPATPANAAPTDLAPAETREDAAIKAANGQAGFWTNLGHGLARGAEKGTLGGLQAMHSLSEVPYVGDIANAVIPGMGMLKDSGLQDSDFNDVAKETRREGIGTGAGGTIGEMLGDPRFAATLPLGGGMVKGAGLLANTGNLMKTGAAIGGGFGFTDPTETNDPLNERGKNAVTGMVGGALLAPVAGGLGAATGNIGGRVLNKLGPAGEAIAGKLAADTPQGGIADVAEKTGLDALPDAKVLPTGTSPTLEAGLKANQGISAGYDAATKQAKTLYDAAAKLGEGKTLPTEDMQQPLDDLITELQGRQHISPSEQSALNKLVAIQKKMSSPTQGKLLHADGNPIRGALDGQIGYNDLVDLKQALNEGFKSNQFGKKGDNALSDLGYAVKSKIQSLGDIDQPFVDAINAADSHWKNNVARVYRDNGAIDKLWQPEDYYAWRDGTTLPATLNRAADFHSNITGPGEAATVLQALPEDHAMQVLQDRFRMGDAAHPSVITGGAQILHGNVLSGLKTLGKALVTKGDPLRDVANQIAASTPEGQLPGTIGNAVGGAAATGATAAATDTESKPRSAPGVPEPALPALSTPVAPEAPHAAMPGLISDAQASESTVPNSSLLQRIGKAESNNDPNAYNPASSAYGQYQLTTPTFRSLVNKYGADYGITAADRNNPVANTILAHLLTNENRAALRSGLGREPNDADIYAAHFLGAPTAVKFLSALNYNGPAARLAPAAAAANPKVFFRHGQPLTPAQVYQNMQHRIAS